MKDIFEKFSVIHFEFGGTNIDSETYFKNFWYLLKNNIYIYRISPSGPIFIKKYSELDELFHQMNYLAFNRN
tara:strand:+ start:1273 stop:1488 length:216 start_codon:yes stop_codon:yes gene_type:complete